MLQWHSHSVQCLRPRVYNSLLRLDITENLVKFYYVRMTRLFLNIFDFFSTGWWWTGCLFARTQPETYQKLIDIHIQDIHCSALWFVDNLPQSLSEFLFAPEFSKPLQLVVIRCHVSLMRKRLWRNGKTIYCIVVIIIRIVKPDVKSFWHNICHHLPEPIEELLCCHNMNARSRHHGL